MKECGVLPNVVSYSAAVAACESCEQWAEALNVVARLVDTDSGLHTPDAFTYHAAMSACEKGGEWERTGEWLAEMRRKSVESSDWTYNAIVSACQKGGQVA